MPICKLPCVQFDCISKLYSTGVFRHRRVRALDSISLQVSPGDVFGLIGPNRAGKTTLVKVLLSICRPTQGRFTRLGRDGRDRATLARVGYVHERPSFPRYLTAPRLLHYFGTLALVPKNQLRRRTVELLQRVGLAEWWTTPIGCYSKGMFQRLALAQALINDPELLVLDEPTEGMDLGARRLMREIVRQRRQQGATTILVSHALGEVQELCNRVAVLREGRLKYCGSVADLLRRAMPRKTSGEAIDPLELEDALAPFYEEALV
jgi:ABC-2 type transport system ATP-binding protein